MTTASASQIESKSQKRFDVFVSHSSKNADKAAAVVDALEQRGVRCWIAPRNIIPGKEYAEAIVEGIELSQIFVLVFSEHANSSGQIIREVERAAHNGLRIIPFRIENLPPSKSLEYFISSSHWLDAHAGPFSAHLEYLTDTVRHLLGQLTSVSLPALPPTPRYKKVPAQLLGIAKSVVTGSAGIFSGLLSGVQALLHSVSFLGNGLTWLGRRWKPLVGLLAIAGLVLLGATRFLLSPFDPALVGSWQMTIPGAPVAGLPELKSDGTYSLTLAFQETGFIEIRSGWVYLVPKNGRERRVIWEPLGPDTVAASLVPEEFANAAARWMPEHPLDFESLHDGTPVWSLDPGEKRPETLRWKLTTKGNGTSWDLSYATGPGNAFKFQAIRNDSGAFRSKGSNLSLISAKAGEVKSEFQKADENTLRVTTPLGQSTWKRKPASS